MSKSNYLEKKILDHTLMVASFTMPTNIYVACFESDPTETGTGGTEVAGGSYVRQTSTWDAATLGAGATANSASINFSNMPATTVTHVALFDAVSGGNMLYYAALTSPQAVSVGNTFTFAIGDIDITES